MCPAGIPFAVSPLVVVAGVGVAVVVGRVAAALATPILADRTADTRSLRCAATMEVGVGGERRKNKMNGARKSR